MTVKSAFSRRSYLQPGDFNNCNDDLCCVAAVLPRAPVNAADTSGLVEFVRLSAFISVLPREVVRFCSDS